MTVQIRSDPMMPIGRSLDGFLHSSAAVDIASNPIYAKKIRLAPTQTPWKPFGMKGLQFAGFTNFAPE